MSTGFVLYTGHLRVVKSRRLRWDGHVAQTRRQNPYRILVGKSLAKRPFGKARRKWEDNIKKNLREIRCEDGNGSGQCLVLGRWTFRFCY